MLNIAVCDDEPTEIKYITALINEWGKLTQTEINIACFSGAEAFLFKYETDKNFNLVFLDIQMKAMDGIELAKKIRETDSDMQIVFITGFPDYISSGYDVSALHYLIKPVEKEKLFEVISRANKNLKKVDDFLLLSIDGESIKIKLDDINYVEALSHKSRVGCKENEFVINLPISEIEKKLNKNFIHCHRSYLANLKNISRITKTDIFFDNGKIIPVSRRMYNTVNTSFINFYRGIQQ